jgi:ABC-type uncharacterized transport system ATPase subunit
MTEPILQTVGLSIRFGGVEAVRGVNLCLAERELRCLIGPNGAGKSTLFKLLTGQLQPTTGRILFHGEDITGDHTHAIARRGIGIKTQVPNLFDALTVREHLWLAARRTTPRARARAITEEILERPAWALARRQVGELAHGHRQLVEIGLVLAQRPWLILLDEPAAGITGAEADQLVRIIHEVNRKATVVVVDHDMQFVRMLGGKVTVMHQGAVLREGPVDEVLADAKVREVYIGSRAK